MRIEPIDGIYELKEKGGLLGNINLRLYFDVYQDTGEVVLAKAYKKDEEGSPPRAVVLNAQTRLRSYRRGEIREGLSIYRPETDVA